MKNLLKGNNNYKPKHRNHQNKITEEMDKNRVNMDMIEELSKQYVQDTEAWNDPVKVGEKLKELANELNKATNPQVKKKIALLIGTYEVQNKKLLTEIAERNASEARKEMPVTPPTTFKLDKNDELVNENEEMETSTQMSGVVYTDNQQAPQKDEKEKSENTKSPKRKMPTPKGTQTDTAKQQKRSETPNVWNTNKINQKKKPSVNNEQKERTQTKDDSSDYI